MEFKLIRLIMNGKILDDLTTLERQGIKSGTILHCAFTDAATAASAILSSDEPQVQQQLESLQ